MHLKKLGKKGQHILIPLRRYWLERHQRCLLIGIAQAKI